MDKRHYILSLCLGFVLGACQAPVSNSPESASPESIASKNAGLTNTVQQNASQIRSTDKKTVAENTAEGAQLALAHNVLQGQILMPSGLQQEKSGLLMPSGILIPSGILMPSGFQALQASDSPQRYNNIPFSLRVYRVDSGQLVAQSESDGQGAYLLSDLLTGVELRIIAEARALPELVFQAFATLPETPEYPLSRNLTLRTTAAVLLAENAKENGQTLVASNVQNEDAFSVLLEPVEQELKNKLGRTKIGSLNDLLDDSAAFLARLREILLQSPNLTRSGVDALQDPAFFGQEFDPSIWPIPTILHTVRVGERQYPLVDGTCPPPPPAPDGTFIPGPPPDEDGLCPALKENTPIQEGHTVTVVTPEDGSTPFVLDAPKDPAQSSGGTPNRAPGSANGSTSPPPPPPNGQHPDLAKAAAILGISEMELRNALGPPPPDLQAAAQKLGITFEKLKAALDASF